MMRDLTKIPKGEPVLPERLKSSWKCTAPANDPCWKSNGNKRCQGCVEFDEAWESLSPYGIQPCGNGIQIYCQPQNSKDIERLGKILIEIAKRHKS